MFSYMKLGVAIHTTAHWRTCLPTLSWKVCLNHVKAHTCTDSVSFTLGLLSFSLLCCVVLCSLTKMTINAVSLTFTFTSTHVHYDLSTSV